MGAPVAADADDREQVYGSQLGHRVSAYVPREGRWRIMTPTEAVRHGYSYRLSPAVDGYPPWVVGRYLHLCGDGEG